MTTLQDKSPSELNVICAELSGWKWRDEHVSAGHFPEFVPGCWMNEDDDERVELVQDLPPYATSYDAIMREIAKLTDGQIKKFGSFICNLIRPSHVRIPEAWTADQHELIGDVIHRISPADLTRALILTLQSK